MNKIINNIIFILALSLLVFSLVLVLKDGEVSQKNITEQRISVLERIVVLIKYNETECPDLIVYTRNQTIPIMHIYNLSDIKQINYVEIGRYDINVPNVTIDMEFLNQTTCRPELMFLTNSQFIQFLIEAGIPIENKTHKLVGMDQFNSFLSSEFRNL